jgi:hypothetical protein
MLRKPHSKKSILSEFSYLVQSVVMRGNKVAIKYPLIATRYTLIINGLAVSVADVALI